MLITCSIISGSTEQKLYIHVQIKLNTKGLQILHTGHFNKLQTLQ